MKAVHRRLLVLALVFLCGVNHIQSVSVSDDDWRLYKETHGKTYPSTAAENNARYYYAYNLKLIKNHNSYADRNKYTYWLAPNQFTDMRLVHFNALFPQTTQPPARTGDINALPPVAPQIPTTYSLADQGVTPSVYDQGTSCGSGWAYATTAAIEIYNTLTLGTMNVPLSAQQFIDCASLGKACTGQVPQAAFDYMTEHSMELKTAIDYPNDNKIPSPCRPLGINEGVTITKYSDGIKDGEVERLKATVAAGHPVVIEFNPTSFEFMHYSYGVFQQPSTSRGSHYMVVVGYDAEHWILLNSFSEKWGDGGYMKIKQSDTRAKLPKSATLPTEP